MNLKRWCLILLSSAFVGVANAQVSAPFGTFDAGAYTTMGHFRVTEIGVDRGYKITGVAMIVRGSSSTQVYTQVCGLDPNLSYGSHVHDLPATLGGGGHYKIDPTEPATLEDNEIWPFLVSDGSGVGIGEASVAHVARPEAQSIVIHDPSDGTRIAICDLGTRPAQYKTTGTVVATATGIVRNFWLAGSAKIRRDARTNTTIVSINVSGLTPNSFFASHVHNLPSYLGGGGHYKKDVSVPGAVESNEIWCPLNTAGSGRATFDIVVEDHLARPEAQTIVIHDTDGARIGIVSFE